MRRQTGREDKDGGDGMNSRSPWRGLRAHVRLQQQPGRDKVLSKPVGWKDRFKLRWPPAPSPRRREGGVASGQTDLPDVDSAVGSAASSTRNSSNIQDQGIPIDTEGVPISQPTDICSIERSKENDHAEIEHASDYSSTTRGSLLVDTGEDHLFHWSTKSLPSAISVKLGEPTSSEGTRDPLPAETSSSPATDETASRSSASTLSTQGVQGHPERHTPLPAEVTPPVPVKTTELDLNITRPSRYQPQEPDNVAPPSQIDILPTHGTDLLKPLPPTTIAKDKTHQYKLETKFYDEYIEHRTECWLGQSSVRVWETSKWKKKGTIGSGNFGTVLLQEKDECKVEGWERTQLRAVKEIRKLNPSSVPSQELLALVKLIGHEHLFVKFLGWYENELYTFLAMEYVEHGDLGGYISNGREKGTQTLAEAKEITRQILQGLEVLHGKDIYHRDLKPQNILMASLDPIWVKIADFGVSKRIKNTSIHTLTGTQGYSAPEMFRMFPPDMGSRPALSPYALDMWSLGAVVHKLLTNEIPFMSVETDEEWDDITGVQTEVHSEFLDQYALREYCHGHAKFPVAAFERSPLPLAGEADIRFIAGLMVPHPARRPTATRVLQDPWVTGYTSRAVETLREEFLSLGVDFEPGDAGKRDMMRRQMGTRDITNYMPSMSIRQLIPLLCGAIVKGRRQAMERLLTSLDFKLLDKRARGTILKVAIEAGNLDAVKSLLRYRTNIGACVGDEPLLQWAIKSGHVAMLDALLTNERDFRNVIRWAVRSNDLRVMQVLQGSGIDMNLSDDQGQTALHMAARDGQFAIANHLLKNNAAAVNPPSRRYLAVPGGQTPLQAAASGGHVEVVKLLLEHGADVNAMPAELRGLTALQAACNRGHIGIAELLLENKADINAKPGKRHGRTALQAACAGGHIEVAKLLMGSKAAVNASPGAEHGLTALQAACGSGHADIVELLLDAGANVNARPRAVGGQTALQAACGGGHMSIVKRLLAKGARVNAWYAEDGGTALQAAAGGGHLDIARLLIVSGADVNATASKHGGRTALQAAAESGHLACVELLLSAGADVNAHPAPGSLAGRTALQGAAAGGHTGIVKLLVSGHGAHVNAFSFNSTALHEAARSGSIEAVRFLLDNGANVDAVATPGGGRDSNTPLAWAMERGHAEICRLLLDRGADFNGGFEERDKRHYEPAILVAARGGHLGIVRQLLGLGADANARLSWSSNTFCPLHEAAAGGHEAVVQLLLSRGADINSEAVEGGHQPVDPTRDPALVPKRDLYTALMLAARGGHMSTVHILLQRGAARNGAHTRQIAGMALREAARGGHMDIVKRFLEMDNTCIDISSEGRPAALELAAAGGHYDIVKLIWHTKEVVVGWRDKLAELAPALTAAAAGGRLDTVELLLSLGADANAAGSPDTPLQAAVRTGDTAVAQLLLESGADRGINNTSTYPQTTLHIAAAGGELEMVQLLLKYGANVNTASRDRLIRPLQAAAFHGHADVVKLLLDSGAQIDAIGFDIGRYDFSDYDTALACAANNGHTDVFLLLLQSGAGIQHALQKGGQAFELAVRSGHWDIAHLLLGENPALGHRRSVVQAALTRGDETDIRLLLDSEPVTSTGGSSAVEMLLAAISIGDTGHVERLLAVGAEVNATSLLFPAVQSREIDIIKLLLRRNADVNGQADRESPLRAAAALGYIEIVKLLLDNKADVNANRGTDHESPLALAAAGGHIDIVKLLIERGADVNIVGSDHVNQALAGAFRGGNITIIRALLDCKGLGQFFSP